MTLAKDFQEQLDNSGKMQLFEIEVKSIETREIDYLVCNIEINEEENQIHATRPPINSAEMESNKIAYNYVELDEIFSLDEHLQELYNKIIEDIINNSEYYTLP